MQQIMTGKDRIMQKLAQLRRLSADDMAKRREASSQMATPPDGIQCVRCGNTGYIEQVRDDGYTVVVPCPECSAKRKIARYLKQSGVSMADYARYRFANFDTTRSDTSAEMKKLAIQYVYGYKPNGPGLGFFGSSGMGKTHLCIAVCQELTKRYNVPHSYFSYRTQMPELIKAMKDFGSTYEGAMYRWKTCQNLYIDDLFKLSGKVENGQLVSIERDDIKIMFDIVNARYLNHLPTFFSSEYSVGDIAKIDAALGSRIFEMINPYALKVQGSNQRLKGA